MLGRAGSSERGLSSGAGRVFAHLLSLLRPVLGAVIVMTIGESVRDSALVLPLTLLACASDYLDGPLARRSGADTQVGRLLDGFCDVGFLVLALTGMARAHLWSGVVAALPPAALPGWQSLDLFPIWALAMSFGVYLVRISVQRRRGQLPARSSCGHRAGIANYGLVLVGAAESWPTLALPHAFLQSCCVGVSLLNLAAIAENLTLLFPRSAAGRTMRR